MKDGEGVPDRSERPESFELVLPPSNSAVDGGGGSGHAGAHAWWFDFTVLDPRFSVSQTDPQCALNTSKVNIKSKSNSSRASLVTSLLHKCESSPWKAICKFDSEMIKTHVEVDCQVAEEIQDPS